MRLESGEHKDIKEGRGGEKDEGEQDQEEGEGDVIAEIRKGLAEVRERSVFDAGLVEVCNSNTG